MTDDSDSLSVEVSHLVSPCCGSGVKRYFDGAPVCSACFSEIDMGGDDD